MKLHFYFILVAVLLVAGRTASAGLSSRSTTGGGSGDSLKPTEATATTTTTPTTTTAADQDESEPATRTTDSLSVNSDEVATTTSPISGEDTSDESASAAAAAAGTATTTTSADEGEAAGIEPKSINRESEANTLSAGSGSGGGGDGEEKANLMSVSETDAGEQQPAAAAAAAAAAGTRLNMSEIDHAYVSATKDEQEIVESWHKMNKKLKKGISSMIGSAIPWALNMSQEAKISSNCSGAMLKWVLSMNQLKSWALRMLDASGKPIAGLLEGSLTMFGNYRECLKIRAPDDDEIEFAGEFREYFRGKYCIIQAKPWLPEKDRFYNLNTKLKSLSERDEEDEPLAWYEKTVFDELSEWLLAFNFVNIRMDVCVPSLCTREDLQKVINYLLKGIDLKVRVARCELDSGEPGSQSIIESNPQELPGALSSVHNPAAAVAAIQMKSGSQYYSKLGWILVPLVAVGVVLIASILSTTMSGRRGGGGDDDDKSSSGGGGNKLRHTIRSLSLKRSVGSHLNIDYDQLADDKPLALYGIRFLLVMWILLVESAINLKFEYLRELLTLKDLIFLWPMQFVINSSLQFDSMILLTAFTMAYKNCLNSSAGNNNSRSLFKFLLDKYVRLMPSIMLLVALVILLPQAYRGPVWNDYVLAQSNVCQANGWINIAFLQNYLPYRQICLPQTWLLSVELQLVLLMAPVVYFLNKSHSKSSQQESSQQCLTTTTTTTTTTMTNHSNKKGSNSPAPTSMNDDDGLAGRLSYWLTSLPGLTLIGCILFGSLISFYNVYSNQLPPSWLYTMADPDSKAEYFTLHLMRLWTHVAVFGMGLIAGLECRRAARKATLRHSQMGCGYKASNMTATNGLGALPPTINSSCLKQQQQRGRSSSASSLPAVGLSAGGGDSSASSDINSSTVSINMHNNNNHHNHQHDSHTINTSESGRSTGGADDHVNIIVSSDNISGAGQQRPSLCTRLANGAGCLLVLATMGLIIFSTHDWSLKALPEPLVAGLYDAVSRFTWSLGLIWILYMVSVPRSSEKSVDGAGAGAEQFSAISRALGHPLMVSLGKLSFLIYILHPFVHSTVLAIQEQPIYSSWLMLFHILVGNITITVILALLVSLFVEMPCRNLFRRCATKSLLLAHHEHHGSGSAITSSSG